MRRLRADAPGHFPEEQIPMDDRAGNLFRHVRFWKLLFGFSRLSHCRVSILPKHHVAKRRQ
jgi:hypothetical protein